MMRPSPITRIAFGLTCLSTTMVLAAATLGLLPDRRSAVVEKRRALAETLAINCSLHASQGNYENIETCLRQTVRRNPDLLSARVQRPDGTHIVEVGQPGSPAGYRPADSSEAMSVSVPVVAGKRRWGDVQLYFEPLSGRGMTALLRHPLMKLLVFLSVASFVAFFFYMRSTLQYLDPSKVMPDRVRQTLDTLAEGLMVVDDRERIVHTNEAFSRLVGKSSADLRGRRASQLPWCSNEGDQTEGYPWTRAVSTAAFETGVKLGLDVKGLGNRTFMVNASSITDDKGQSRGALVSLDDVTALEASRVELRTMLEKLKRSRDEIQRQNQELEEIARVDPLTSCLNRRVFYAEFEVLWNVARRYGKPLSCVMVDIDHFKFVNDRHGHSTGDSVLQLVSKLLLETARDCDLVCRYGGEEFCVLLPETDIEGACQFAERSRRAVDQASSGEISVTASFGATTLRFGAQDPRELLDQADKALYAAKRGGRNQTIRFDEVPEDIGLVDYPLGPQESARNHEGVSLIPFPAVSALMSALSFRDAATAEHCQRVADLCSLMARTLMSPSEAYTLEMAALLHDIGKIGVPDAVLLKPGRLTEEEWKIMKAHDRMGVAIVQEAFGVQELTSLVGDHHAWYAGDPDNSSSPAGQEIPLGARILAIAEAYDAMVSDSPYRSAIEPERAFEELRAGAGKQFDPEMVERFIAQVKATDTQLGDPTRTMSKDAIAGIACGTEELAKALENQDVATVAVIAERLASTAEKHDANYLGAAAKRLQVLANEDGDLIKLAASVGELLELCRETQRSYLNAGDACGRPELTNTEQDPHDAVALQPREDK